MELKVAIVYDEDFNMQPYVGVTKDEVYRIILEQHKGQVIESYGLTEEQFDALEPERQLIYVGECLNNPDSKMYWDGPWVKFFEVETHPRIVEDINYTPDWQKVKIAQARLTYEYRDMSDDYDWGRWEREATEEHWLELYEAHEQCEGYAADFGGRDTWVAIADNIWDGLIPRVGDDEDVE